MTTINEAAQKRAKKVAWQVSSPIALLFLLAAIAFLSWDTYFRVETGLSAISNQLSHLLKVGDTFQLKTQLLSLASSGTVDHFALKEPSGITIAGDGSSENPEQGLSLPDTSHISLRSLDGALQLVRKFEIPVHPDHPAVLIVSKKLHLEIFLFVLAVQALIFLFVHRMFRGFVLSFATDLTEPISVLASSVTSASGQGELSGNLPLRDKLQYLELNRVLDSFIELLSRLGIEEQRRTKAERDATLAEVASQVAHDIRSPLSALNMLIQCAKGVPENERFIFRSATQRINDIANNLLSQSRAVHEGTSLGGRAQEFRTTMLTALVDSVVSEKRVQYRLQMNLQIETDFSGAYGLFVRIQPAEMARVLSNLIDNSVEAFNGEPGTIVVGIVAADDKVRLRIQDNGKGIPPEICKRLGKERISFGKTGAAGGAGLGLLHARKTLETFDGVLSVESKLGHGTIISLVFPRVDSPEWFVQSLTLNPETTVVTVDDDQTIHQIWEKRLSDVQNKHGKLVHVAHSSVESLRSWLETNKKHEAIFLVDYEFLRQAENGLDAIGSLQIADKSILVSSRYDEPMVRAKAEALGVKMIPKNLAAFIPLEVSSRPYDFLNTTPTMVFKSGTDLS